MNVQVRSPNIVVSPFIDGTASTSLSDETIDVIDPSSGIKLHAIPAGCEADVDRAVRSARVAFTDGRWNESAPSFRKKVLHRFADLISNESSTLDALDAGEMGKPVNLKFGNASGASDLMRFYAEGVDKVVGDAFNCDRLSFAVQRWMPRGVVAAVIPWNFPTSNFVYKVGPALAAGNCMVLKPSELSSRSAVRLAQLALEAGIPEGVLNVIPGAGQTVGQALGLHNDIDMMSFTGSTRVGKLMMQYAGQSNMKVVMAECGGKSPQIVFADGVDLDEVSESIASFMLTNQGQICSVGSRVLVQRPVEELLCEKIKNYLSRIVIGSALDQRTTFGPLVSAQQYERILRYINDARNADIELMAGGQGLRENLGGFFLEPTLFRNVPPESRIAQDEIFGPVLCVTPFDDVDDAIRIANDTMYGLSAYVWTAKISTGMRVARGVKSMVFVNAAAPRGEGAGNAISWEPFGQSGIGTEGGMAGMESYLRRQYVGFNYA